MGKKISRNDFLKAAASFLLGAAAFPVQKFFNTAGNRIKTREAKYYKRQNSLAG